MKTLRTVQSTPFPDGTSSTARRLRSGAFPAAHRSWPVTAGRTAAVACAAAAALAGCGFPGPAVADPPAAAVAPTKTPTAKSPTAQSPTAASTTAAATSGMGSVKDSGDLPDPCALLTRQEVTDLTDRAISQIDEDDAQPGEATRYCQWQQDGGQLALFLSRTTPADFGVQGPDAAPVGGIGDDAFQLAGHLFVLYGTVQIDIYSRGSSDRQNLTDAKEVATVVMPRI